MYTLYFLPDACSLATQSIINELGQPLTLVHKLDTENYETLNPIGTVPVLLDGDRVLNEGVAIILHLLNKHKNNLIADNDKQRQQAIENMLFANASMHPAYGRLFFIDRNITHFEAKLDAFLAAANTINTLWRAVESKLGNNNFLGGNNVSPADFMLAVYSRWGQIFPVEITVGPHTAQMIERVICRDSFQLALQRESAYEATQTSEASRHG